jgi:glycine hydroxymethyltransferase
MNQKRITSEIYRLIEQEAERQKDDINLIASENYTSDEVLHAMGSILTNKYAEGYPSKRYYAGCEYIDQIELLAVKAAKQLFGADHVNVQPHSGTQANMAVYLAMLSPGDTILSMSLDSGGHLSHGYSKNFSGTFFKTASYGVDKETECLDYDTIMRRAQQSKPRLIIAGASSYSRSIDFERFAEIARSVGAYLLVDMAHIAGLVATGLHQSPITHADFVTTTTQKTLCGPRGGMILCKQEYADRIDKAVMPGIQGGPFMHVIAAKAIACEQAASPEFMAYQKQVVRNAKAMACQFQSFGYRVVSGGTDTHQFTLDMRSVGLTGKEAEQSLQAVGITVNRNLIPLDTQKPWVTSGIRIGTAALTTKGFKEAQVQELVRTMDKVLKIT